MTIKEQRKAFEEWAKNITKWDLYWSENINKYMDHQTNAAWLAWLASANREGYKLVPVEPTIPMIMSAYDRHGDQIGTVGDIYKAMIGGCDEP